MALALAAVRAAGDAPLSRPLRALRDAGSLTCEELDGERMAASWRGVAPSAAAVLIFRLCVDNLRRWDYTTGKRGLAPEEAEKRAAQALHFDGISASINIYLWPLSICIFGLYL